MRGTQEQPGRPSLVLFVLVGEATSPQLGERPKQLEEPTLGPSERVGAAQEEEVPLLADWELLDLL